MPKNPWIYILRYLRIRKFFLFLITLKKQKEQHQQEPRTVLIIEFEMDGNRFTALNGGPQFPFTEAISLSIQCETQQEIDYYWLSLTADGGKEVECGWLNDKFGVSWQVAPTAMAKMITNPDAEKVKRVFHPFIQMKKLDLAKIEEAYRG